MFFSRAKNKFEYLLYSQFLTAVAVQQLKDVNWIQYLIILINMINKTVLFTILILICAQYIQCQNNVHIQLGIKNTISFDVSTQYLQIYGLEKSHQNSKLSFSFNNLPNWVDFVNGSTISGIPPIKNQNYQISIRFLRNGQFSNSQKILLTSENKQKNQTKNNTINRNHISYEIALDYNNIYNPINPNSPYNPYNPHNPNGINYSGQNSFNTTFYQNNNINNPINSQSIFNPANKNSVYNPYNPISPFYIYGQNSILNPKSSNYIKYLSVGLNPNNTNSPLNPLNPESIFYPKSTNYLQFFKFNSQTQFGYIPNFKKQNDYQIKVFVPVQPIAYTPPPNDSNKLIPSYVSTTSSTYSTPQIQGLLVQQKQAQKNLVITLTAYNNANNVLKTLQDKARPLNKQLKQASVYLNQTSLQLQRAISNQSIGANITNTITNILMNLTTQLNFAQQASDNANQILASDQSQLAISRQQLVPTQSSITVAQITYNKSLMNAEVAKQRIKNCQQTISNSQQKIDAINHQLQLNPAAIQQAKAQLELTNHKIAQIQALLKQAQNQKQKLQNDINVLIIFPQSSISTINIYHSNITQCQASINNLQSTLPSLSNTQAQSLITLNNAQRNFQTLQQTIKVLQNKIPQHKIILANITQRITILQALINLTQKNITSASENKNILDNNVLTLRRQLSDATDNMRKVQAMADDLKLQIQTATVSFSLSQNAYDQARLAKQAADNAVNRIIVDNRTKQTNQMSTKMSSLNLRQELKSNSQVYSFAAEKARILLGIQQSHYQISTLKNNQISSSSSSKQNSNDFVPSFSTFLNDLNSKSKQIIYFAS